MSTLGTVLNSRAAMTLVVVAAVGVGVYYVGRKVAQAVGDKTDAVNPASDQNLAYRGVNAIGAAASGDPSWSLGSWLYDMFNPPYDPNAKFVPRKLAVREESQVYDYLAGHG